MKPPSGRLEPVLVDLDFHVIVRSAAIVRPYLVLPEAHAVERLRRQAGAVVGKFLGVGKGAAQAFDHPDMAADVPGRTQVPGRIGAPHPHPVAGGEAGRSRGGGRVHAAFSRASTSAILRPSSSAVRMPRCRSTLLTAMIQRS